MAGQSAQIWQAFLWGIPHQQRVGADCCSLLLQVRNCRIARIPTFNSYTKPNHNSIEPPFTAFLLSFLYIYYLSPSTSNLVVYVGRQNQKGSNPNEVNRGVTQIMSHPNYTRSTNDNDMCLLKLSSPVTFTNYIRPVCLAAPGSSFHAGTTSWVTGWGTIRSGGEI